MSRTKSMPLLPRLLIGAVLFLGGMYLLMRLWVGGAIEDAIAQTPDEVTYESMFLRFNGDFGIEGVKGVHPLPDGTEKSYTADRLVVHTPGLLWLARIGWAGESDELPDDIGFTVENLRLDETDDKTDGNYSNLPFDAVGCGKRLLTPGDMSAMGFGTMKRNATMRLTRVDDNVSKFLFEVDTPGVGGSAMEVQIGIKRPLEWAQGLNGLITAPIKSVAGTATDHGFIAARNAWCAKAVGVEPAAFVDHHMRKLDTHLAEEGMTLGVGALDRYRDFAAKGGELKVVTIGDTKLTLGDFMDKNARIGKMAAVRTGIRHNGGPLASFEVGTQPKIARVDPAPAAAAAPVAPAAGAPALAMPAPLPPTVIGAPKAVAATTASAQSADTLYKRTRSDNLTGTEPAVRGRVVATGEEVAYASLEKHIGERVQITTKMGSVRHGTVLSSNSYQTNIKLDAEEGGFNLNVFADTVATVRLIPASANAAAQTTK